MIPGFQESILILVMLVIWAFIVAMLIDIPSNKHLSKSAKAIWFVIVLFIFVLGATAYYVLVKHPTTKAKQQPSQPL